MTSQKTRFDCGWNDTVHGLSTCQSPQELFAYIKAMRDASNLSDYSRGAMAVIDNALFTGQIPQRKGD